MAADSSTIIILDSFVVTERSSRGTTPTTEKSAPGGFQHLEQPIQKIALLVMTSSLISVEDFKAVGGSL